ncbi:MULTISPECIES: hypothetical protein [Sinorhizobium]|uniref:Uncharacterized protein n=1 Tax=Sinorhizobium psoraleae TaxID=520838 RepID=A0ABT4KII8_9HYPH|nr:MULTISPECIES: hypothetical protein [Sinorhizobium]MCZ4091777.1 hypothetical protein [Sinorhizobium psoraleae]MDK1388978.1 hypothetical protein [Sinorhizobium sp. 7-81]NRP70082.1 hypothetical protein [Sinorhizobium psoraleae]
MANAVDNADVEFFAAGRLIAALFALCNALIEHGTILRRQRLAERAEKMQGINYNRERGGSRQNKGDMR